MLDEGIEMADTNKDNFGQQKMQAGRMNLKALQRSRSRKLDNADWRLSRRQLFKLVGLGGAAIGATGLADGLLPTEIIARAFDRTDNPHGPSPQWAMIIDLRMCDACDRCIEACRKEHSLHEDQSGIKVHSMKNAGGETFVLPAPCMQCDNPPCVKVCPVHATYKTSNGIVDINRDRCIGCRMCMAACPYDARYFNWSDPLPQGEKDIQPQPQQRGTVGKCGFCAHLLQQGELPACVRVCTEAGMAAIYVGDLTEDLATNGEEVVRISRFLSANDAFRYQEELGTKPRVFYIPGHGQHL